MTANNTADKDIFYDKYIYLNVKSTYPEKEYEVLWATQHERIEFIGSHNFTDGQPVVEGKDYEVEEQFWTGSAWWPTKHLIDSKPKILTKTRIVAVPIDYEMEQYFNPNEDDPAVPLAPQSEQEDTLVEEKRLLETIDKMCIESLCPEIFEKWEDVKAELKLVRKKLKY